MATNDGEQIGHGKLGVLSNLQSIDDLIDASDSVRDVLVELRPIKEVTGWSLSSGATYVAPFDFSYDSYRRDVVGVASRANPNLTRGEDSSALSSGEYYYNPAQEFTQDVYKWDTSGAQWDDGVLKWDQFPQLYVRLDDDSDPGDNTIAAKVAFYCSNKAQSQPVLGPDLLTDGTLDSWSGGSLASWTFSGTGTETEETSDVKDGDSSLKLTVTGTNRAIETQQVTTIDGARYRLSGWYKASSDSVDAEVAIDDGTNYLLSDGRSVQGSANYLTLSGTQYQWRRFIVDFRAWNTTTNIRIAAHNDGDVYFDGLQLRRIWRYEFYLPRVTQRAIPSADSGSHDIFFGGKRISVGSVGLLNQDGYWDTAVGQLEWMNQECVVKVGGRFRSEFDSTGAVTAGQAVPYDNLVTAFTGLIQNVSVDDALAKFSLQDQRVFFHRKLPDLVYDDQTFANLDTAGWQGKVRPIFFGVKENITPARIDYESVYGKYGKYEICDTTNAPNGIKSIDKIYAYTDKTAADLKDSTKQLQLTSGTHYTEDLTNGRFTIDVDIGPYEIISGTNDKLNWDEGGSELTASLTAGLYTAASLASHVQAQMRAASGAAGDENCTYSDSTNKFTISKDAGTLNLKVTNGSNKDRSIYRTIGFTDDKSGSLSYVGDEATFTSADQDHVLRVNAQGYKDDASGTYTGTANSLIEIGAHICKVLIIKFMGKPSSVIDSTSFDFTAARATESLAIYLNESTSTKDIFDTLEYSNIANIVVDGSGKVRYKVYTGTTSAEKETLTHVHDRDIQKFSVERDSKEIYKTVRIKHDKDPTSGVFQAREATDTSVPVRLGRPDILELETYLKNSSNAINVANRMLELARKAARKIHMTVLGSILMKHEVGDKIRVTRRRALAAGGVIDDFVFRILSIRKDYVRGLTEVELTDDRVTVAATACITSCQTFCENACQEVCEQGCQTTCEGSSCQDACEVGCQVSCQTTCQQACELSCQSTCELSPCQSACELSCQTSCESGGCQTACEASCQTTCELTCQGCAQTTCETVCQSACQATCQLECQTCAQISCQTCQTACETSCQNCEGVCMTGCEIYCQDSCQTGICQTPSEGAI